MKIETFGQRLFWARRNHARLTQLQLRDAMQDKFGVDVGRNYISQLENDDGTRPTFEVAKAMAGTLEISLDYLAGFTDSYVPAQREEAAPHYFSPEADEVARLVDNLRPEQRTLILGITRSLTAPTQRQREEAEMHAMLDSVEREMGVETRKKLEKTLRVLGLLRDTDA